MVLPEFRGAATLFVLLLLPVVLCWGQEDGASASEAFGLEIRSYSGSPLLLHLELSDQESRFTHMEVETDEAFLSYGIEDLAPEERASVEIPVSPFRSPGVYDLTLRLRGPGNSVEIPYRIGFADFVWGRDNFRFGNNRDFETLHGDYSLALFSWLEERFGDIPEADRVLLVHYMYGLFGRNPGRCYAFSGSQYRYLRWPDLLPRYNDDVFEVRGSNGRIKREMHYLQMDIVFDYFVARGTLRHGSQSVEDAREEVEEVLRRIAQGEPVVAGFLGPELHHSMLIYGFVQRLDTDAIELLVANNWKADQDSNVDNLNAELVRVNFEPTEDRPLLEWLGRDGLHPRQPTRFIVVDVREQYDHDRVLLEAHVGGVRRQMQSEGLKLLIVENAASAWLTDGEGAVAGYERWRTVEEIPGVTFQRRKRAYSFEIASDEDLQLHIEDEDGARAYFLDLVGGREAWVIETQAPEEELERVIDLATGSEMPEARGPGNEEE